MDQLIQNSSQFKVLSKPDLKSAHHQIHIKNERKYMALEACGNFYQFCHTFQRYQRCRVLPTNDGEQLSGDFAYVDKIVICGCVEIKVNFLKPPYVLIIKATKPFET